jgi:hypothetical protein
MTDDEILVLREHIAESLCGPIVWECDVDIVAIWQCRDAIEQEVDTRAETNQNRILTTSHRRHRHYEHGVQITQDLRRSWRASYGP